MGEEKREKKEEREEEEEEDTSELVHDWAVTPRLGRSGTSATGAALTAKALERGGDAATADRAGVVDGARRARARAATARLVAKAKVAQGEAASAARQREEERKGVVDELDLGALAQRKVWTLGKVELDARLALVPLQLTALPAVLQQVMRILLPLKTHGKTLAALVRSKAAVETAESLFWFCFGKLLQQRELDCWLDRAAMAICPALFKGGFKVLHPFTLVLSCALCNLFHVTFPTDRVYFSDDFHMAVYRIVHNLFSGMDVADSVHKEAIDEAFLRPRLCNTIVLQKGNAGNARLGATLNDLGSPKAAGKSPMPSVRSPKASTRSRMSPAQSSRVSSRLSTRRKQQPQTRSALPSGLNIEMMGGSDDDEGASVLDASDSDLDPTEGEDKTAENEDEDVEEEEEDLGGRDQIAFPTSKHRPAVAKRETFRTSERSPLVSRYLKMTGHTELLAKGGGADGGAGGARTRLSRPNDELFVPTGSRQNQQDSIREQYRTMKAKERVEDRSRRAAVRKQVATLDGQLERIMSDPASRKVTIMSVNVMEEQQRRKKTDFLRGTSSLRQVESFQTRAAKQQANDDLLSEDVYM